MNCQKCKNKVNKGDELCENCNTILSETAASHQPSPPAFFSWATLLYGIAAAILFLYTCIQLWS